MLGIITKENKPQLFKLFGEMTILAETKNTYTVKITTSQINKLHKWAKENNVNPYALISY